MAASMLKLIDIAANLTDPMFRGIYHGSQKHLDDLNQVLEKAKKCGLEKIILTGTSYEDSLNALEIAKDKNYLFSTVGCHPTRCDEFQSNPEKYFENLLNLILENKEKVVAVGEIGLDYDRLEFCSKETQVKYFKTQLQLAEETKLPLFLHCRNSASDLLEILRENRHKFNTGVVHSFDGSKTEADQIIQLGLYIGINGCSLKTQENLNVAAELPREKIMIETDCPWCDIRPTHAGYKYIKTNFPSTKKEKWKADHQIKGRNEPANVCQVLEILSAIRNENISELSDILYENTRKVFFPK